MKKKHNKRVFDGFKRTQFEREEKKLMALQKKVTVGDTEYVLQHPGVRGRLKIIDDCTGPNGLRKEDYAEKIIEHVVVSPKVKLEDFDDKPEEFEKLLTEASRFLNPKG